jgi:crotonobetaine/carnitine-CoA ligase
MNKLDLSNPKHRTFARILERQAAEASSTVFLRTDEVEITFAEAESLTNRLASGLLAHGLSAGDRVALYMSNQPEMVLLALAINKLSAVWVPINRDYKGQWLEDTVARCRAKMLFTDSQGIVEVRQLNLNLQSLTLGVVGAGAESGIITYQSLTEAPEYAVDHDSQSYGDTCAILWTSGTTGRSKGVMQPYNAWVHAIVNGASMQYQSQEGDVIYNVLPLFNAGGWITAVLRALLEGITVVIEQRFSVTQFWDRIAHFGATQTFALGAMGTFLLNEPERADDAATPLREAQIVPLAPDLWPVFSNRFGVRLIRGGLGQSECMRVLSQAENRDDVPVYALGFPDHRAQVTLLDDDGNEVPVGEVGEIAIKPLEPYLIFNGYFDDPEATQNAFKGDWYCTGDVGRQDPKTGAFFYVDRKRDAVRFGGRNISTLEVESVARRFHGIADVAAYGISHPDVPEEQELALAIVVAAGESLDFEELCGFLNQNAPYYFVPRYITLRDALPYTPTNKVQKYQLQKTGLTEATWDLKNSGFKVRR